MIGLLIRRSLAQHLFSSLVTGLSVALATGLLLTVVMLNRQAYAAFTAGAPGYDAILGARGSQLQLVLNGVYLLETSPGNLPWSAYEEIRQRPEVKRAVPYALGDTWQGHPVVGTLREGLAEHQAWAGSAVGLREGQEFHPTHGAHDHEETFRVTRVLASTGGPEDRAVFVPLEEIWELDGHTGAREVSGVLLELTSPQAGMALAQRVNREGKEATLAWPLGASLAVLFERLGWVHGLLEVISLLVLAVACGSIAASLASALAARRQEFAVLRALGAHPSTLLGLVTGESAVIAGLGSVLGLGLYAVLMGGATWLVRARTGVTLHPWQFDPLLVAAPLGITVLGALSGLPAGLSAYSTEAAAHL